MESSFIIKTLLLIIIVGLGMVMGNSIMAGIIYLIDGTFPPDLLSLIQEPKNVPWIKLGIGISHFFSFTFSSLIFVRIIKNQRIGSYFKNNEFDLDDLFYFLVLLMVSYPLIVASAYLTQLLNLPEWAINSDRQSIEMLYSILSMDSFADFIVNLIIVALLPAIGEELLFRGIIQQELIKKLQNPIVAVLITSIIFSAFHLQLVGFLPKLIIGFILGYSYYMSRSIWLPIVLHFINNGIQVVGLYVAGDRVQEMQSLSANEPIDFPWVSVLISIILCFFVIRSIRKINTNHNIS